jgi:hypothetical protein
MEMSVLSRLGVLEDGMEHHAQVLLALSICAGLSLTAWIWARRQLTRLRTHGDGHETM